MGREHIEEYVSVVARRHPGLPSDLLERCRKAETKGQAQRIVKKYLQERSGV